MSVSTVDQIVEGRGWYTWQVLARPKARFFTFISVAWIGVVGFGLLLFWAEPASDNSSWRWLYLMAGLPEPIFIGLAILFWFTEEQRTVKERYLNPGCDPRKLY